MSALDIQHGGGHYKGLKIQPVEFIMSNQMGFCEGNVVKYVTRWRSKGGLEDLKKARHFLQFMEEKSLYRRTFCRIRVACKTGAAIDARQYIQDNGIRNPEAGVLRHIWFWNIGGRESDLEAARKWLDELIEQQGGDV